METSHRRGGVEAEFDCAVVRLGHDWCTKRRHALAPSPFLTLAHLPIAYIAGVFGYMISPTFSGGAVYWMDKFSRTPFLQYLKKLQITGFYTVPSIYLRIAKSEDVTDQFDTVETAITGAAPIDAELQQAANAKLRKGSTRISQTWGLSETTVRPKCLNNVRGCQVTDVLRLRAPLLQCHVEPPTYRVAYLLCYPTWRCALSTMTTTTCHKGVLARSLCADRLSRTVTSTTLRLQQAHSMMAGSVPATSQ
jgi:acyl-CoA synthetase (AMP-forming)/AMP-acid ligase II